MTESQNDQAQEVLANITVQQPLSEYEKLKILLDFLSNNLEENKHNVKQLKILEESLEKAKTYQNSVSNYQKSNQIPRTWTDLNKYTRLIYL